MISIKVAEIPINISCHDKEYFSGRFKAYQTGDTNENSNQYIRIDSAVCDDLILPRGEIVEKIRALTLAKTSDGRFFYYTINKNERVVCCTEYDPEYKKVMIRQLACRRHTVFSLTDFEYMYTGMAFSNRLAYEGGLVLHASALSYKGQGIAFSAISGTGKSTHTGLWRQYLGDDVEIVNDDKPAIRFVKDKPILYGTPWSGKTDLNNNISVPLSAIVFLERAQENKIRRLSAAEAYFDMANEVARPSCDEALGVRLLDSMERLLESVPVYKLSCNMSRGAVQTVYEEIIGGKMP